MENTPQHISRISSENEFENLMTDFAAYLKANQSSPKTRKILAHEPENQAQSTFIPQESFSEIYQNTASDSQKKNTMTARQKAQCVMDEIEKLIQVIENHQ